MEGMVIMIMRMGIFGIPVPFAETFKHGQEQ
ncbi:hypothetical protein SAMN05216338_1001252 [Bradyrhizobium sp. Rc2d]|nr:hypothetical protein SAMN05216338_1001252 [Bradyrhizobium sp. Rc2d]